VVEASPDVVAPTRFNPGLRMPAVSLEREQKLDEARQRLIASAAG
jgi:hypothetical protein